VGLAFQIRDDILDAESINNKNDKNKNSDEVLDKATWPKFFGLDESENYCNKLINKSTEALKIFPNEANMLRKLITYLIKRSH
jgi:geranylgeranyl pyrophosphate synthase